MQDGSCADCTHADWLGPVWILEGEIFNRAGEVVRRVVIPDGLDQVSADLNGVARFVVKDACLFLPDELVVHFKKHLAIGIPVRFEVGGTSDRGRGTDHRALFVGTCGKTQMAFIEVDAVAGLIAAVSQYDSGGRMRAKGALDLE